MKRGGPLKRTTPLPPPTSPLKRTGGMSRGKQLQPRSARREAVYAGPDGRRALVARLLAEHPRCQGRVVCSGAPSMDVHEVKSRARGGSILDPANLLCLCRPCHDWTTTHPAEALAAGLLKNSWD